jgi:hypothetical protein
MGEKVSTKIDQGGEEHEGAGWEEAKRTRWGLPDREIGVFALIVIVLVVVLLQLLDLL